MLPTVYATRDDAAAYVEGVIEGGCALAVEYHIDDIVDACFTYRSPEGRAQDAGFALTATDDEFWEAVAAAQITEFPGYFEEGAEDEMDEHGPTGRALLTFVVGADPSGWDDLEVDRIQVIADDAEEPMGLGELEMQLAEQGWRLISNAGDEYRVARL